MSELTFNGKKLDVLINEGYHNEDLSEKLFLSIMDYFDIYIQVTPEKYDEIQKGLMALLRNKVYGL